MCVINISVIVGAVFKIERESPDCDVVRSRINYGRMVRILPYSVKILA